MFCSNCGKQVDEKHLFCANCGNKIEQIQTTPLEQNQNIECAISEPTTKSENVIKSTENNLVNNKTVTNKKVKVNVFSIIGFVTSFLSVIAIITYYFLPKNLSYGDLVLLSSFLLSPVAFISSIIGLNKKNKFKKLTKLAILGIIISLIVMIFLAVCVIIVLFEIIFNL